MEKVRIGGHYLCQAIGLEKEILGVVEKIYTNTVMVNVIDYHDVDENQLIDFHYRVLVKHDNIFDERSFAADCEMLHNSV